MDTHTLAERAAFYAQVFPKFPAPRADERWLDGMWVLGNDYRSKSGFYGSHPPNYLKRVMALFPDAKNILQLFSGSLEKSEKYTRFDINPKLEPDVLGDAHELAKHFKSGAFDLILADPPYSVEDCEHYGTCMIKRNVVLSECAKVVDKGGFIVWLDQVLPMFRKVELHLCGLIGLVRSTNHRFRVVSIFQKV